MEHFKAIHDLNKCKWIQITYKYEQDVTQDFAILLQGRVAFRSRESDQWSQVTEWHGSHCPTAQLDGSLIELSQRGRNWGKSTLKSQ